jgi:hypothetical protein
MSKKWQFALGIAVVGLFVASWNTAPKAVKAASSGSQPLVISTSSVMTLKFSELQPNATAILLGEFGIAVGIPPTTDTRLITVSNASSGNINLYGYDNTSLAHILATVGANQTVALVVPTVWLTTGLTVINFGSTAAQGVVTIN